MKNMFSKNLISSAVLAVLCAGCTTQQPQAPIVYNRVPASAGEKQNITLTPQAIPGTVKAFNSKPTGGYAPTNVQAQLKIDVKDGTKQVRVIRDSSDPFVITKPYILKNADPYAVRSYLEAAVGAKSVTESPAQVSAVKFQDGTGVVLVSAEAYRFTDSADGKGIDKIVTSLDRKGLTYLPEADAHIYFPRISRASNLRDMLLKVGSSELDPQFAVAPGSILVDGELNALIVKAPMWNWLEMLSMLKQYDKAAPEVKVYYRVLEIYAENDDRIGIDFQTWKNNEGVDLFSAGLNNRRNWGTFFTSGVQNSGSNNLSYWNFNPKWNTRYLDFMTSIGKAKCLAQGVLLAKNRVTSNIQVNTGFFYDRTSYNSGLDVTKIKSVNDAFNEFTFTDVNPDAIQREAYGKILPYNSLVQAYNDVGVYKTPYNHPLLGTIMVNIPAENYLKPAGYVRRMMGTQTGANVYLDAMGTTGAEVSDFSKYFLGFVDKDGNPYEATWYNNKYPYTAYNTAASGIIHGTLQYPMVQNGFKFDLAITPVVTGKAAKLTFAMNGISLLGWNSDGSARTSTSNTSTTVQIGYTSQEFVIGGLRKSESVRGASGLPFFKDLPVIGRVFSTESESIKQSQLVLLAHVEYSFPDSFAPARIREDLGKIIKGVNKGMDSRVGNMFFQQYFLDNDREARIQRLDTVGNVINDEYKEVK